MPQILVVDDEERVALSIERSLQREYQVQCAYNGLDAMKIARRTNPDLIILDIMMDGMNGLEVCRELRNDPLLHSVPILFLTARGRLEEKIEGLEAGADDYLTKPFDVRELLLRVRAIIRRTTTSDQKPDTPLEITVGQLTLNCQNYHLSTDNESVLLTPVEFDLMYHMMSYPGQVFGVERLLRDVWDYPSGTGSSDLVRMHIRNLRLKIEPNASQPRYILTVPRHGYTIATE